MPVLANDHEPRRHPSIVTAFGYSPLGPAMWRPSSIVGLEYRDLSLTAASKRAFGARHLRVGAQTVVTDNIGAPSEMFAFVFLLSGSAVLIADGQEHALGPLAAVTRTGIGAAEWRLEPGTELVEIVAARALWSTPGAATWTIRTDSPEAYILGEGPRKFFDYRDLGVATVTDRRVHIHVVRAAAPPDPGGTGWHCHTMGQIFYVLRGHADLTVAEQPWVRMTTGDAMCLAAGMRHNVPGFSDDYVVLEMCIPADYDTVDTPAPVS